MSDPLVPESGVVVSHLTWVIGTKLRPSVRQKVLSTAELASQDLYLERPIIMLVFHGER